MFHWLLVLTFCPSALFLSSFASDVLVYTDANFETEIAKHKIALAEFYAPWCGHCKALAPEYEKAATLLKGDDTPISLIKVDCTVEEKTCEKFGVEGYPTLKIFRDGQVSNDYGGPMEANGLVKYMRAQSGPSAKELKTLDEFNKFIAHEDGGVVGFFKKGSKLKESFQKVADTERDRFRFAYTTEAKMLEKKGHSNDIIFYTPKKQHNKFEPNEFKYDGDYDTENIKNFIQYETTGLAGVRTQGNQFQFAKQPLVIVYYNVDYVKDPKGSNYWRNRVLKVAQEYKDIASFAVSNKDEFSQELEENGIADKKDSDKPIVCAHSGGKKYPMKKEFSIENLKHFVDAVLAGKLESFLKSEPIPTEQGDLKTLVAKNFKEMVLDVDKDALIEFYAPWCGHCKELIPKFEELAKKMAKEKIIIGKFDATANEVPSQFSVSSYPTIYWLPKNAKESPVLYEGGRDVIDFVEYIAGQSTEALKGYTRDGKRKSKSKKTEEL